MKIAECAHLEGTFQSLSLAIKIPTVLLFWLPVADIGVTHNSVSNVVKAGHKARYKASL